MTQDHFMMEMRRVMETYGDRFYPEPKLSRIWKFVEPIEWLEFKGIVDVMLDTMRSAPLPDHFRAAALPFIRSGQVINLNVEKTCSICADLGWLNYGYSDKLILILCSCDTGTENQARHPKIPQAGPNEVREMAKLDPKLFIPSEGMENIFNCKKIQWWNGLIQASEQFWTKNPPDEE